MSKYMGHSPSKERNDGIWQTLKDHVEGVTERTEAHVHYLAQSIPEMTTYAKLAGYLHDLGKYRDDFQIHRLKWHPHEERHDPTFEEKAVPHSDAGARLKATLAHANTHGFFPCPLQQNRHNGA